MKSLAHFLVLSLLANFSFFAPSTQASTTSLGCEHQFTDIVGHWGEEAICQLYELEVVEGYSPYNFSPNSSITRAEFLKLVLESLGYAIYSVQSAAFSDTKAGEWYYPYVTFAHSKGFVSGYGDGTFRPNSPISRAEALSLIIDITGFIDYDTSSLGHQFTDVTANDWFAIPLAVAVSYELIEGYGDGSFRPNASLSRAEAALLITRTLENFY